MQQQQVSRLQHQQRRQRQQGPREQHQEQLEQQQQQQQLTYTYDEQQHVMYHHQQQAYHERERQFHQHQQEHYHLLAQQRGRQQQHAPRMICSCTSTEMCGVGYGENVMGCGGGGGGCGEAGCYSCYADGNFLREERDLEGCGRETNFHDALSTLPPTTDSSIAWSAYDQEQEPYFREDAEVHSEVEGRCGRHSEQQVEGGEGEGWDPREWEGAVEYGTPQGDGEAQAYIEWHGDAEGREAEGVVGVEVDPRRGAVAGHRVPHNGNDNDQVVEIGRLLFTE
eukprot:g13379.t1